MHRRRPTFTALISVLSAVLVGGCGSNPPLLGSQGPAISRIDSIITSAPNPVSLGELDASQSAKADVLLKNASAESVVFARFETSCPCVTIHPPSAVIHPHETFTIQVNFNPLLEPHFRGRLRVAAKGLDPSGAKQWGTDVVVEVADR